MKGIEPEASEQSLLAPHMTQGELARLWRATTRTLDRWRVAGTGPVWLRVNGRILYRVVDVRAFEAMHLRHPTD